MARGERDQVLLGVTGSGKTFTIAHVIAEQQRPAIVLAPNKTLAAQLYGEMKSFFPDNAVEYFVSYYDYYQPEAYVPRTDTYIEKESSLNEQIDRMRHSATRAMLERNDVIIVASVSCIYGIGSVETYSKMTVTLETGDRVNRTKLLAQLRRAAIQAQRPRISCAARSACAATRSRCSRRITRTAPGAVVVRRRDRVDPRDRSADRREDRGTAAIKIYANSHYVTPRRRCCRRSRRSSATSRCASRNCFAEGKLLEAQRLEQRTTFDIEMIDGHGQLRRHRELFALSDRARAGEPPPTFFEYLPRGRLVFVDESHVTVPQLGGMFRGDWARKSTLAEYGFRLPSCTDNRPLKFEEWERDARPDGVRLGDAGAVGDGAHRRRLRRAGGAARPGSSTRSASSGRSRPRSTI